MNTLTLHVDIFPFPFYRTRMHRKGLSILTQNNSFPLLKLLRVMLAFATTHMYPTWILHSNTCKDEVGNLYGIPYIILLKKDT